MTIAGKDKGMKVGRALLILLMAAGLAACDKPATPEDRKALVGLWIPDDGSRHTIEFKNDGVFDFVYDYAPIRTTLRVKWSLDKKGKVDIRQDDGSYYKTCTYAIEGTRLTIDDGNGAGCIRSSATPTTYMPTKYTKSP